MLLVIKECISADEVMSTYAVMCQLRTAIKEEDYLKLILSMRATENYRLIAAYADDKKCIAVAGIRFRRSLFRNGERELYIDDLITDATCRSQGIGHTMMEWLKSECKKEKCVGLVLDSGRERIEAHKFYEREGMTATSFHFYRPCSPEHPRGDSHIPKPQSS